VQEGQQSGIFCDMTPILAQKPRTDRAFERMYRKHAGDVYRYALVVLRNQADAEDVTQTTFMNAYRAFERGERPRNPQNWLIAIAHNVCRQRFRQSQRRPNEVAFDEDVAEAVVDEDAISAEDIRRALGHLAFNQRAALVMRELEGRSYQEIAEILGVSVSAVETLIFRARRALREQLEEGITCREAELAISRQLDGRLSRKEKGALRAHLRECDDCARFARSQRAQRGALKSLGAIPLPQTLASFFGGGSGAAVGGGLAVKAAAIGAGAIVASGAGYEGVKHGIWHPTAHHAAAAARHHPSRTATASVTPATLAPAASRTAADDLKPFRPQAVESRQAVPKSRGNGANESAVGGRRRQTAPGRQKHIEVSALPPSRAGRPVRTPPVTTHHSNNGRHVGPSQTRRHTPPPPPPPPPKRHSPPPKRHSPPPQHPPGSHAPPPASSGKSNG
jgi:RNA polymerase sigma-70 factor (ECF subfamily)